jgi:hypothetical protein
MTSLLLAGIPAWPEPRTGIGKHRLDKIFIASYKPGVPPAVSYQMVVISGR